MAQCKLCQGEFTTQPLLHYENMPRAAQHLPSLENLNSEKGTDILVYACPFCGFVQLTCEPVPYYKEVIRASGVSKVLAQYYQERFSAFAQAHNLAGKKVLEVGCGEGSYLALLNKAGMIGHGMEFSDDNLAHCHKQKLDVVKGYMDGTFEHEKAPFSAFFMFNFLEHFPSPKEALLNIAENVEDGAVGLIEVPSFDMMYEKKLFSEFIPDHLGYFSKATLQRLVELCGFDVVQSEELRDNYVLSMTVRKRATLTLDNSNVIAIVNSVDAFIEKHQSIAFWGAGHQAFAILAMLQTQNGVSHIIDSAPFKQGKYSPATHIPIVAPQKITTLEIHTILIVAGSYSDEIASIVKKEYPNINVAVLREFGVAEL